MATKQYSVKRKWGAEKSSFQWDWGLGGWSENFLGGPVDILKRLRTFYYACSFPITCADPFLRLRIVVSWFYYCFMDDFMLDVR